MMTASIDSISPICVLNHAHRTLDSDSRHTRRKVSAGWDIYPHRCHDHFCGGHDLGDVFWGSEVGLWEIYFTLDHH